MKRFIFLSFWNTLYLIAVTGLAWIVARGVLDLQIGPVVWTLSGTHGVHLGDVVIATIAAFLVLLFTIGLILAHRQP